MHANKRNKFVLWVTNLSAYTKNKTINVFLFFLAYLIIGGTNHYIMFKHFVPTFFLLDFFLIVFLVSPIFFFKKTMFDRIYLPILLAVITGINVLNSCFFLYFGTVFSIKDILWGLQTAGQVKLYTNLVPWWIVGLNIGLFVIFALAIILFNALWKFQPSNAELKLHHFKKIGFTLALLFGSAFCYEVSLQSWCAVERKHGINDIDYVNYSPNYHYKRLGAISYYVEEVRQKICDHGETDQKIKEYLLNYTPVSDDYTGVLSNPNIITIMIETGDQMMLNKAVTPCLWSILYGNVSEFPNYNGGLCCSHNYSINHTNVSSIIGINGNHPQFHFDDSYKVDMPFNLPNILKDTYHTYITTDIHRTNDIYHTMPFMHQFNFENYWFHNEIIPEIQPWNYKKDDFTRDSIFIQGFVNKIVDNSFPTDKPFYLHYLTMHMHMQQVWKKSNAQMWRDLEHDYGPKLDAAEAAGEWKNPFAQNTENWKRFRRYTLKTMNFDDGLRILCNALYGSSSSDYLKNTLLVVYGDHHWYENTTEGPTFAKHVRNVPDTNIKQYATVLGLYHPQLSDKFALDFPNHTFNKPTWPSIIVPTILDLCGIKYNTNIYEGKSIFDSENYSQNEIFFSNWKNYFMNEHFTSNDGHYVTHKWDNEQTKKDFEIMLKQLRIKLRAIDSIYLNNFFHRYDYSQFLK